MKERTPCSIEPQSQVIPVCYDCEQSIVCSQSKVAECEAKLFCKVTQVLSCEIAHTRCLRDLERLINLTNKFLLASAKKEAEIAKFSSDIDAAVNMPIV